MKLNRRPRAYLFTELLVIIGLLAVAGLLASRLFTASMWSIDTARSAEDRQAALEQMTSALRRDTWGAMKIDSPDAKTIVFSRDDGAKVQWQFNDADIARSETMRESKDESTWTIAGMEPKLDGAGVTVRSRLKPDENQQWRFISPMLSIAEGKAR